MDQKAKRRMASNIVYILTAVIVVSMICMVIYTGVSSSLRKSEAEKNISVTEAPIVNNSLDNNSKAPLDNSSKAPLDNSSKAPLDNSSKVGQNENKTKDSPVIAESGNVDDVAPVNENAEGDEAAVNAPLTGNISFFMPVEGVLSKSYEITVPVFSVTMNDYRVHSGVDFETEYGSAVFACANGTICDVYKDYFMGSCVVIDHGNGIKSYYKNLADEITEGVAEGMYVKAGQIIGCVGETALMEIAEEPHLHFEMTKDDVSVNPFDYVNYTPSEIEYTE